MPGIVMWPPIDVMFRMWPRRRAHERQHRLHRDRAEYVHVELPAHCFERRFFHHAFVAVAGVVDQHVDGADARFDLCDDGVDCVEVGHVEHARHGPCVQRLELALRLALRTVPTTV
jgi:hypothetical protein